jgi:hypothetical protein
MFTAGKRSWETAVGGELHCSVLLLALLVLLFLFLSCCSLRLLLLLFFPLIFFRLPARVITSTTSQSHVTVTRHLGLRLSKRHLVVDERVKRENGPHLKGINDFKH